MRPQLVVGAARKAARSVGNVLWSVCGSEGGGGVEGGHGRRGPEGPSLESILDHLAE